MFGWRARIGLLIIQSNTVMESEFNLVKPDGVSIHAGRIPLNAIETESLLEAAGGVEDALRSVSRVGASSFVVAATAATFVGGKQYDQDTAAKLSALVEGKPVITAANAVLTALRAAGVKRIACGTAYSPDLNQRLRSFLEENDFEVLDVTGMDTTVIGRTGRLPPEFAYKIGRQAMRSGADALYLAPAGMRTITMIAPLEEDLGVPVISSGQASIWAGLRSAGVMDRITGYGSLLEARNWPGAKG